MPVCVRKLLQESQPQQKLINNCLVSKDKAAPMQQQKERGQRGVGEKTLRKGQRTTGDGLRNTLAMAA